jgi:sec-independent protein translocase protein TatC
LIAINRGALSAAEADNKGGVKVLPKLPILLPDPLVKATMSLIVGCGVGVPCAHWALSYLARLTCPDSDEHCRLIFVAPLDALLLYLKAALYFGVALSLPIIVFQFFRYLAPGLTRQEMRLLYGAMPFVVLLFAAGSLFGLHVVLPAILGFIASTAPTIFIYYYRFRVDALISMALTLMLGMGLLFQTPLMMVLLTRFRVIPRHYLVSWWRYAVVVILATAAVITPTPDATTMLVVAVPVIALYVLGLGLAHITVL